MNKLLTLFWVISCCWSPLCLKAQTIFAPQGAAWYFGNYKDNLYYLKYWVEKDTLVQDQPCTKIARTHIPLGADSFSLAPMLVYTSSDTVFYYNDTFSRFLPLYIFNVKAGDTITYHVPYFNPYRYQLRDTFFHVVVEKVDTLVLDGQNLRRVWTKYTGRWIFPLGHYTEKISSPCTIDALIPMGPALQGLAHDLRCYTDPSLYYNYEESIPCDYLAPDVIKPDLWVYPNPNNGHFTVESTEPIPAKTYFTLWQTHGRKIAQWETTQEQQTVAYPGPPLAPGIYFLTVRTKKEKHYYYLKIVVQP